MDDGVIFNSAEWGCSICPLEKYCDGHIAYCENFVDGELITEDSYFDFY